MSNFYTVQSIIGRRIRKGVAQYKVKWLGYPEDDCTWQPLKNLKNVEDMVNAYEQEHGDAQQQQNQGQAGKNRKNEVKHLKKQASQDHDNEIFEQSPSENINKGKDQYIQPADGQKFQEATNNKCFQEPEQDYYYGDLQEGKGGKLNSQTFNYDISIGSAQFEEEPNLDQQQNAIEYPAPRKAQKTQQKATKTKFENSRKQQNQIQTKQLFQQRILQQVKKSQLQQVQEKMRFKVKAPLQKPSKELTQTRKLQQLIVLQISKSSRTMELMYLTQQGPIISYKSQTDMKKYYPDQLIKFYESRIEFAQIPKISR